MGNKKLFTPQDLIDRQEPGVEVIIEKLNEALGKRTDFNGESLNIDWPKRVSPHMVDRVKEAFAEAGWILTFSAHPDDPRGTCGGYYWTFAKA
jgi:hypothetical protein